MWIRPDFFVRWARDKGADFLPETARPEYGQPTYVVGVWAVLGAVVVVVLLAALVALILR